MKEKRNARPAETGIRGAAPEQEESGRLTAGGVLIALGRGLLVALPAAGGCFALGLLLHFLIADPALCVWIGCVAAPVAVGIALLLRSRQKRTTLYWPYPEGFFAAGMGCLFTAVGYLVIILLESAGYTGQFLPRLCILLAGVTLCTAAAQLIWARVHRVDLRRGMRQKQE